MLAARLGYLWDTMGEGPGLSSSSQGMGCSVRGTDLAAGSLMCWVFLGGDVPGKPVCSGAGVYTLHPKQGELALVPVCSGSYQSHRIAPRLYTGWDIH